MFLDELKKVIRGPSQEKASQSVKVRDGQEERVAEPPVFQVDLQRGRLRTFEVDACLVDVCAIQAGPQRGVGDENFPPTATYVGQRNQFFIWVFWMEMVPGNEGQNFRWELIDG